jgi:hypothetical protein
VKPGVLIFSLDKVKARWAAGPWGRCLPAATGSSTPAAPGTRVRARPSSLHAHLRKAAWQHAPGHPPSARAQPRPALRPCPRARRWARLQWCARQHEPWADELARMAPSTLGACISCSDDKLDRLEFLVSGGGCTGARGAAPCAPGGDPCGGVQRDACRGRMHRRRRKPCPALRPQVGTDAVQLRRQARAQRQAQAGSPAQQRQAQQRQAQQRQLQAQRALQQPEALGSQQEEAAGLGGMWSVLAMSGPAFAKRFPSFEAWQAERAGRAETRRKAAAAAAGAPAAGAAGAAATAANS